LFFSFSTSWVSLQTYMIFSKSPRVWFIFQRDHFLKYSSYLLDGWIKHPYFLSIWCHTIKKGVANPDPKYKIIIMSNQHVFHWKWQILPRALLMVALRPQKSEPPDALPQHDAVVQRRKVEEMGALTNLISSQGCFIHVKS
jgi:hypothetical protein